MGKRVRDGAITFSDLVGTLDELAVECAKWAPRLLFAAAAP